MATDDQPEPDEVIVTRAGPLVGVVQTFHAASGIEIRLDLWPADDERDDDDT